MPGRGRGQAAGVCVEPREGSREPGVRKAAVSLYVREALGAPAACRVVKAVLLTL